MRRAVLPDILVQAAENIDERALFKLHLFDALTYRAKGFYREVYPSGVVFGAGVIHLLPMRNRTLSPFSENLRAGAPSYPLEMTTSVAITLNIRCSFLAGAACYNMIYFNPFREETEKQKSANQHKCVN